MQYTLDDIFNALSEGELAQVFVGNPDNEEGCIPKSSYRKLTNSVVLGLTALHTRFLLKQKELVLELDDSRSEYLLDTRFAQSNADSLEPVKYIQDTADPYTGELLRVERVLDPEKAELLLNRENNSSSFMTPNYRSLKVPSDYEEATVILQYRANHEPLDLSRAAAVPADVPIELPPTHLAPLLYFVAARVTTPTGMVQEFHEGNMYLQRYEFLCRQLEDRNFHVDQDRDDTDRFATNGWV